MARSEHLRRTVGGSIEGELDDQGVTLLRYWKHLRGANAIPFRRDFDPVAVPAALSRIQIVQYDEDPERLTYRLVGTKEVETRGYDPTGMSVADGFFGAGLEDVLENYKSVLKAQQPVCVVDRFAKMNGVEVEDIALFLPLLDDNETIKFIMVYSYNRPVGDE